MDRRGLIFAFAVAVAWLGAGCGDDGGSVEANRPVSQPSVSTEDRASEFSAEQLRAFRDAAAGAPYWYTARRLGTATVEELAGLSRADTVIVGTVQSVTLDGPRAGEFRPQGSPLTLYNLEVVVRVAVQDVLIGDKGADSVDVRIPVISGGIEGLGSGRPAGERIAASGPVGATGVFIIGDSWGEPVAFQSSTGEPVAFLASMDREVSRFTTVTLAEALADSLAR